MYTARVFFFDLRTSGADYVERYAYHQGQKYPLASFERILCNPQQRNVLLGGAYYLWMQTLQDVLDLPTHKDLRPKECQRALILFRQTNHNQMEADAIEAILLQYFLFEAARRVPIPPPASQKRKRQRRPQQPAQPPIQNDEIQVQCTILGLTLADSRSQVLIEKAFRRLALSCHPDKWGHLPENEKAAKVAAFKAVVNARDTLIKKLGSARDS